MKISGIRSFTPDHAGVIEFYTPLTIIVGQNGAGKTVSRIFFFSLFLRGVAKNRDFFKSFSLSFPPQTIIEALKYATTGDPPPSTGKGGQGFVHDPKVANEREVKAQIKLKFKNVTKKSLTLTRSMSLGVTQKKQTFKTLESVLQIESEKGEVRILRRATFSPPRCWCIEPPSFFFFFL